jgi:hypothetical protein
MPNSSSTRGASHANHDTRGAAFIGGTPTGA